MTTIQIQLRKATVEGRLYYQPDKQVEKFLIYLRSPIIRKTAYSINIAGGLVLLGADENGVLKDIEINILRKNWVQGQINIKRFLQEEADIQFIKLPTKHYELELPINIIRDETYSRVLISFGDTQTFTQSIILSESCEALVYNNQLHGFLITIR